jgi:CRISPR/Cas system-associated protein Csx1
LNGRPQCPSRGLGLSSTTSTMYGFNTEIIEFMHNKYQHNFAMSRKESIVLHYFDDETPINSALKTYMTYVLVIFGLHFFLGFMFRMNPRHICQD